MRHRAVLLAVVIAPAVVLSRVGVIEPLGAEPIAPMPAVSAQVRDPRQNTRPRDLAPLPRARRSDRESVPRQRRAPPAAASLTAAAQLLATAQSGRADVPRVELGARLRAAGFDSTSEFEQMRENAARELAGRPDGGGAVTSIELANADREIARELAVLQGFAAPRRSWRDLAKATGRPQIDGLKIVYLHPLGRVADANKWRYIIAHQTEGPSGSARALALAQAKNPTKRGVTLWVEIDGTVYWATAEDAIPTHGDGANRNDNKYVDNAKTYRTVVRTNSLGVEFVGNFPDVSKPVTSEQVTAWLILVRFLQERYDIPSEHIYAHNWIDYKDHRYCEGCQLGTLARSLGYQPGKSAAGSH